PSRSPTACAGPPHHSAQSRRRCRVAAGSAEAGSTPAARASRPGTRAARAARGPAPARPGSLVSRTASPLSAQDVLDRRVLQREIRIHPLQLAVLGLELLQPLQLVDRGPRVLRAPLEVRRLADVVLPQGLGDRDARLALLQDVDNLA